VTAELEQRDGTGTRLTEMRPEAPDDIGPGGVVVLQNLDGECRGADVPSEVLVETIDVVDASIE
jgi:hypothetical protein